MTQTSNSNPKRRLCEVHQQGAYHVCLFSGCSQHFLCFQCAKDHPQDHSTQVKEIQVLSSDEVWIDENAVLQKIITNQMKELIEEKKNYLTKSEEMIKDSIQLAIATLERKLQVWIQEIREFKLFEDHEEALKDFSELQSCYVQANGVNLRDGDFYEQVENYQKFQNMIWNEAQPAIKNAKERMTLWQTWLDNFKRKSDAFVESIQAADIRSFLREFASDINKPSQALIEENNCQDETREDEELQAPKYKNDQLLKKLASLEQSQRDVESCILGFSEVSRIVKGQHYTYIAEWLPKSDSFRILEFSLLYQATRDGFKSTDFDSRIGDQKPLICFIKSKEHGRIFGGFTSKGWRTQHKTYLNQYNSTTTYIEDEKAFLFSLSHLEKYPCQNPTKALYISPGMIFTFGSDLIVKFSTNLPITGSSELAINYRCEKFKDSKVSGAKSYLGGAEKFFIEEIEVYKVIGL